MWVAARVQEAREGGGAPDETMAIDRALGDADEQGVCGRYPEIVAGRTLHLKKASPQSTQREGYPETNTSSRATYTLKSQLWALVKDSEFEIGRAHV